MTTSRTVLALAATVGLTLLALVAACADQEEFTPPLEDDLGRICAYHDDCTSVCEHGLSGMAPYCTRRCDSDPCPAGYHCVARGALGLICAMGECATDGDCPASYVCAVDDEVCQHADIPCAADGDCPAATGCNQGVCTTLCSSDDDCKAGFRCNWFLHGCMPCAVPSACSVGFAVIDGVCGEACVGEGDCRPGFRCSGTLCEAIAGGGSGDIGSECSAHSECIDFCQHHYCTHTCEVPNEAGQCPEGFYCEQFSMVCVQGG